MYLIKINLLYSEDKRSNVAVFIEREENDDNFFNKVKRMINTMAETYDSLRKTGELTSYKIILQELESADIEMHKVSRIKYRKQKGKKIKEDMG
jgi:hypothetical protein